MIEMSNGMAQKYIVIKKNHSIELQNRYYKQCIEQNQVQVVITTMRKYARIDYDFDTLNNTERSIKDLSDCNISEKIRAYALQYAKEHNLPSSRMPKVILEIAGGFEFFIEDITIVGTAISKIIEDAVESNCIRYKNKNEMIAKLGPKKLKELKIALGEKYFK
jgi:hypothetical protein